MCIYTYRSVFVCTCSCLYTLERVFFRVYGTIKLVCTEVTAITHKPNMRPKEPKKRNQSYYSFFCPDFKPKSNRQRCRQA